MNAINELNRKLFAVTKIVVVYCCIVMCRVRKKSNSGGYGNSRSWKSRVRVCRVFLDLKFSGIGYEISGVGNFSGISEKLKLPVFGLFLAVCYTLFVQVNQESKDVSKLNFQNREAFLSYSEPPFNGIRIFWSYSGRHKSRNGRRH